MLETALATRTPPEIIVVPPPVPPTGRVALVFGIISGAMIALAAFLFAFIPNPQARMAVGGVLGGQGAIFGIIAVAFIPLARRQAAEHRRATELFAEKHAANPAAVLVAKAVADRRRPLFRRRIVELNRTLPPADPPRARLICVGQLDLPEPGSYLFEPAIITPTRYLGRQWIIVAIGLAVIAVVLLRMVGVPWLNWLPRQILGSFGYFYFSVAFFGGAWLWRSMIRPTYIRLAPGVVQVMRFRFRGGKAAVNSFPMEAGTLALVYARSRRRRKTRPWLITLVRDERREQIQLWQLGSDSADLERLWQAVLSTAPIPAMSDEELIER